MKRRVFTAFLVAGTMLLLGSCTATVAPFQTGDSTAALDTDEQGLWMQAEKSDKSFETGGVLLEDPELEAYLQSVVDRLFPEFTGTMNVKVLESSSANAFVLANGSIYLHLGMLSRLDNEAQLAAVLGHESSHFVERHILEQKRSANQTLTVATIFGAATGAPALGNLAAVSSITGFSRECEREADAGGFRRMQAAGYNVHEAAKPFGRLSREIEYMDIDRPSIFFSSHPKMTDRVKSLSAMAAGTPVEGEIGEDLYRAKTMTAVDEYLALENAKDGSKIFIFLLEEEEMLDKYPPYARYYLAQGYRRRGVEGDLERAEQEYRRTIEEVPEFAPSYAALGKLLMQHGDPQESMDLMKRYLELRPEAVDRAYIESYLAKLGEEQS